MISTLANICSQLSFNWSLYDYVIIPPNKTFQKIMSSVKDLTMKWVRPVSTNALKHFFLGSHPESFLILHSIFLRSLSG